PRNQNQPVHPQDERVFAFLIGINPSSHSSQGGLLSAWWRAALAPLANPCTHRRKISREADRLAGDTNLVGLNGRQAT
ncbi:hypothetical protein, partial [Oricola sp.]|uniref:hypothetical protein n=1 Tax=Oricola sp. TaxID=1979950 RepID=UPI0025ED88C8